MANKCFFVRASRPRSACVLERSNGKGPDMPNDSLDFTGKAVLITGASRGIGAATARAFAEAGAAVCLAARSQDAIAALADEIAAAGGRAVARACDVASYDAVAAAVGACGDAFGRLDIMVNNAGVIEPIARLENSDPSAWTEAFDVNAKGVYHGIRAAAPVMLAQNADGRRGGVIVNISSGAATHALEGWSHYCAGKAAALMLTRAAALELGPRGVRVVGLSPGTVATQMQREIKASGVNPVSQMDFSAHIPPEWAAKAVLWLATPAGARFDGDDFRLRTDEARRLLGLPAPG